MNVNLGEAMIQGCVSVRASDGTPKKMPGVCVSNGREVVRTDGGGAFALPRRPEDRFVFVTVPAGYTDGGAFYIDLKRTEAFDFELCEDGASGHPEFAFVQVSDTHISTGGRASEADLKADLDQIYRDAGDRARFIVATGDLTQRGLREEFAAYVQATRTSRLPIYHCIGNHDDNDPDALGSNYMDLLGPTYYSFGYGPVHFVVYDSAGHEWREPDHQDTWLRADLEMQPRDRPVVFLLHHPWGREFYGRWQGYPILASLTGHWHSARVHRDGKTVHYNTPTLCFGGIDQSPRAYRLCTYRDGALTTEVRALVAPGRFPGISFQPPPDNRTGRVDRLGGELPIMGGDWPLFHGDAGRTGAAVSGPKPPLEPAWRADVGGALHAGSPVVAEGLAFVGTQREDLPDGSGLVALDAQDGTLRWRYSTGASIKLAPAFCKGRIFAVTVTGEVVALDAQDGGMVWTYQLGDPSQRWVYMSPLAYGEHLYVGMSSHFVCLEQETGSPAWLRETFILAISEG